MLERLSVNYQEVAAMILFGIGFTNLLLQRNLIKKIIGFGMMDAAIFLFLAFRFRKGFPTFRERPVAAKKISLTEEIPEDITATAEGSVEPVETEETPE